MKCPRCDYEWDVRQSPCPRCNLYMRVPGPQRTTNSLTPTRESLTGSSVSSSPLGERTARAGSGSLLEPIGNRPTPSQFPTRSNELQIPNHPITDRLNLKKTLKPIPNEASPLNPEKSPSMVEWPSSSTQTDKELPQSGALLHRDRYALQKTLRRQEWPLGIVETVWSGLDTRFTKSPVLIYELGIPSNVPNQVQAIPHTATKVFTSIGRHPHVLALRDVFRENERSFFVFEPIQGLSLLTQMRRRGGRLPEQDVINCCIQIADLLDVCSKQLPPLIHGNIRPEYLVKKPIDSQYALINFSVALAGGLAQITADVERVSFSPYDTKGKIEVRTDLSALLATAHYAVTGLQLSDTAALATNSNLSPLFRSILSKGLYAPLQQRYQKPYELYQDLVALRSKYGNMSRTLLNAMEEQNSQSFGTIAKSENILQASSTPVQLIKEQPEQTLPETLSQELPPLKEGHDWRNAIVWFAAMLFCLAFLLINRLL